jgi:hypothetical protein
MYVKHTRRNIALSQVWHETMDSPKQCCFAKGLAALPNGRKYFAGSFVMSRPSLAGSSTTRGAAPRRDITASRDYVPCRSRRLRSAYVFVSRCTSLSMAFVPSCSGNRSRTRSTAAAALSTASVDFPESTGGDFALRFLTV